LQRYGNRKRIETKWNKLTNPKIDPATFSCVDPKVYGKRFSEFLNEHLFHQH